MMDVTQAFFDVRINVTSGYLYRSAIQPLAPLTEISYHPIGIWHQGSRRDCPSQDTQQLPINPVSPTAYEIASSCGQDVTGIWVLALVTDRYTTNVNIEFTQ